MSIINVKVYVKEKYFKYVRKVIACLLSLLILFPSLPVNEKENDGMFHSMRYFFIKKAAGIADKAMEAAQNTLSKAFTQRITEKDVVIAIEKSLRENGSGKFLTAFNPIVASGKDSSFPHGIPDNDDYNVIEPGEVVVVDLGARYFGFYSDITRTFFIGEPTEEMKKIYSIVLEAQEAAIKKVELFAPVREVDKEARGIIEKNGYGDAFVHATGHGLGLRLYTQPLISSRSVSIFLPGEVVTVEPGIYLEGKYGIRIEDDVAVFLHGQEVLTRFPKDLNSMIIKEKEEKIEAKEESKKLYSPEISWEGYAFLFLFIAGGIGILIFIEYRRKILK